MLPRILGLALAAVLFGPVSPAHADSLSLPANLAQAVLSETVPTAFAPVPLSAADYKLVWNGPALPGVRAGLGAESLEWVRVVDVLEIPRAHLILMAENIQSGTAQQAGFSVPFTVAENGTARAELPIAMISGEPNSIQVAIARDGKTYRGKLLIRFHPRNPGVAQVLTDPSCSHYQVVPKIESFGPDQLVFIGCRLVYSEGSRHRVANLEMLVYWDNARGPVKISGIETTPVSSSVWGLRLGKRPGKVALSSADSRFGLGYSIPDRLHLFSIAAGLGPYGYTFDSPLGSVHTVAPLLTVYGSFFLLDNLRVVGFDASPINSRTYADFGVYLNSEYFKGLDYRVVLNLMLGAHVLAFKGPDGVEHHFGAPQGFELQFRDVFGKGYDLATGAFIYPPIQGQSYYNAWLRSSLGQYFVEFNFLSWEEQSSPGRTYSRSIGVSVGMPLLKLF